MKIIRMLMFLVLYISLASSQDTQSTILIQHQIQEVLKKQLKGWNSGKIEEFMDGYSHSDSLRFASNGSVTFGWSRMLDRYKKNYSTNAKMGTLSFTDIHIDVFSNTSAMVFGHWKLQRTSDEPGGLFTLIFKKHNDAWRIVHDHTSSEH